jgi:hypothetical protein
MIEIPEGFQPLGTMKEEPAIEDDQKAWSTTYSAGGLLGAGSFSVSGTVAKWFEDGYGGNVDIIDKIDKIDKALTPPQKCPHCHRDWHPGPLTEKVRRMLECHTFSLDYDPTLDDTPIVCVGAEYHGPNRPAPARTYGLLSPYVVYDAAPMKKAWETIAAMAESLKAESLKALSLWDLPDFKWDGGVWFGASKPEPCELPDELPDIEFGPQNWIPPVEPVNPPAGLANTVWAYWNDFNQQDFPVPDSPGLDFSMYQTDEISYPTTGKKAWK